MSDVSLTAIMVFHFDAAVKMMNDILYHGLAEPDELYEILLYKEKDSESIQEERLWKVFQSFLIKPVAESGKVLPFSLELRGPDNEGNSSQ